MSLLRQVFAIGLVSVVAVAFCSSTVVAQQHKDIVFAKLPTGDLKLDLYMPANVEAPPLVVFIHGGGWKNNSYKKCLTPWLTDHGFAVASVSYRLTDKAIFPAQIHDCKTAVRWLRAHAKEYGYNAERIGVAGTSAGGHLSLLMGVTGGHRELEGNVGGNAEQSSKVQAIVDYYGPTDFVMRSKNQPSKTEKTGSPVRLLLGGPASQNTKLAKLASPAFHVSEGDPPLLIIHGDQDRTVNMRQSERIAEEYKKNGLDVTFEVVKGAGHGGKVYFTQEYRKKVVQFLVKHLKPDVAAGQ